MPTGSDAPGRDSSLSERDRSLFQAWDAFLRGDALEAERIYRRIVGLEPENVEAWLQLGEVLFHSGPRRGFPIGAARKAFERVLFFEPEHTSALLHLARIAASERRSGDLDSLVHRILELSPTGEWAVEAKALRSFAAGDGSEQAEVVADLRTAVESRVWNTARYVAVAAHDLEGAQRLVELLTDPTRPAEVRAFGHLALAHLELARGRARAATSEMDLAAQLDPVPALEQRALLALSPVVPVPRERIAALRDSVVRRIEPTRVVSLETSHLANLHDGVQPEIRSYLAASLSLRSDDISAAYEYLKQLEQPRSTPEAATVAQDAAGSIRAQIAQRTGRPAEAARALEEVLRLEARVGLIGGSPFYSQGLERFLYAGILQGLGRSDEAIRWYDSFSSNSIFDLDYLAPSHLRRGEIAEALGRHEEAAGHYRQALDLWKDCDLQLRPSMQEAERRLARLAPRP